MQRRLITASIVLLPFLSEHVLAHEGHPHPKWYAPHLRWLEKHQGPLLSFVIPLIVLIVLGVIIRKMQDSKDEN